MITLAGIGSFLPNVVRGNEDIRRKTQSILVVNLRGGPPQQEMFRPNYEADHGSEIRGPFDSIPTNIKEVRFCELFPKCARIANLLTIVQSAMTDATDHPTSGRELFLQGNFPRQKSLSSLIGPALAQKGMPQDAAVEYDYLSSPDFLKEQPPRLNIKVDTKTGAFSAPKVKKAGKNLPRRRELLAALEERQNAIYSPAADRVGTIREEAFHSLLGSGFQNALDLKERELQRIFGMETPGSRAALLALQLAEAGSGVVIFDYSPFPGLDMHGRNELVKVDGQSAGVEEGMKAIAGELDTILHGLLLRAPEKGVLTAVVQEVGRGHMNRLAVAGREHDQRFAWVARGGLLKPGPYGSYDPKTNEVKDNPVKANRIIPTLVAASGIDAPLLHPEWREKVISEIVAEPPNPNVRR